MHRLAQSLRGTYLIGVAVDDVDNVNRAWPNTHRSAIQAHDRRIKALRGSFPMAGRTAIYATLLTAATASATNDEGMGKTGDEFAATESRKRSRGESLLRRGRHRTTTDHRAGREISATTH